MAAYQLLEPGRVFFTLTGLEIAAGGSVTFYAPGTTDLQDTWSNPGLTVLNPNPVDLDSSGRLETPAWGDEAYDVLLKDSDGATVWTEEVRPQIQPGATIPALEEDEFLTNDGTNLLWQPVRQVPDPEGSEGSVLQVAGGIATWTPLPGAEQPEIIVGASSFQAGTSADPTKFFVQTGTGSAAASGSETTSVAITFPVTFGQLWHIGVSVTANSVTSAGGLVSLSTTGATVSGCTVRFFSGDEDNGSNRHITSAVTFTWIAFGTIEVS